MRIGASNKPIEGEGIHEGLDVLLALVRVRPKQLHDVGSPRTPFALVLVLGANCERLTDVFLMDPDDDVAPPKAIVALDDDRDLALKVEYAR